MKECHHHKKKYGKKIVYIISSILAFLLIAALTILIIYAILHPSKPRFILQDATVYYFNFTQPNFLTSNLQLTISSKNPNKRIGIYYDKLLFYVAYRNQQITPRVAVPPTYQGRKDISLWSPPLVGIAVPVSPENAVCLADDQAHGGVSFVVKGEGRVRWKVGSFISGSYGLYVKCPPMYIKFGYDIDMAGDGIVKYSLLRSCSVSV